MSFEIGVFLFMLKYGNLVPVCKGGDVGFLNYYKLISLLTVSSKNFERAMCGRLVRYLKSFNILN